jgi:hypothetical protein
MLDHTGSELPPLSFAARFRPLKMTIFKVKPVSLAPSGLDGSPFALRIGLALLLPAAEPVSPGLRALGMIRTIVGLDGYF